MKKVVLLIIALVYSPLFYAQPDPPDNPNGPPVPIENEVWLTGLLIVLVAASALFLQKRHKRRRRGVKL